jgi:CheY-like chemotaxis protein/HPt (histidine-containing phosphotransfer) domain-containing protein
VVLDGHRVRQVLGNLVGNAVKFSPGGRVRLTVGRAFGPDGSRLQFSVSDTGIGIPSDQLERIFDPFSQAHRGTVGHYGGTGLGLSIARRLVELMGGGLRVVSRIGRGSTFWFDLPLLEAGSVAGAEALTAGSDSPAPTPNPVGPTAPAPKATPSRPARVLVVEDNQVNQLLVRRQLERLGCHVQVLPSGEEALAAFPSMDVDLVLMDWQMPGLDGLETARRWRALEAATGRPRVPVVAVTASALPGDRERCLAAGMNDFVAKPVGMEVLARILGTWAGPAEAGAAALDRSVLDRLAAELDDPELVRTTVRTYLRELDARVGDLEAALGGGDRTTVQAVAHTLASTSAALGASTLAEVCRRAEQAATLPGPGRLPVPGDELRAAAADARGALEAHLLASAAGPAAGVPGNRRSRSAQDAGACVDSGGGALVHSEDAR